jgi:hypothetical protein
MLFNDAELDVSPDELTATALWLSTVEALKFPTIMSKLVSWIECILYRLIDIDCGGPGPGQSPGIRRERKIASVAASVSGRRRFGTSGGAGISTVSAEALLLGRRVLLAVCVAAPPN